MLNFISVSLSPFPYKEIFPYTERGTPLFPCKEIISLEGNKISVIPLAPKIFRRNTSLQRSCIAGSSHHLTTTPSIRGRVFMVGPTCNRSNNE